MPNVLAIAGSNSKYKLPDAIPAGFWAGLWHGIITPLLFWISLFVPGVRIYETNTRAGDTTLGSFWARALGQQMVKREGPCISVSLGFGCRTFEAESVRTEALSRMSAALCGAGRYQEAKDWLIRAMQRAEHHGEGLPSALNRLGVLYQCTGDFDEAERLFRQALV